MRHAILSWRVNRLGSSDMLLEVIANITMYVAWQWFRRKRC